MTTFKNQAPSIFVSSSKQLWISILAHLMGLTLAFTRLNAAAPIGFLVFPTWRLFKGGVYFKVILFCKITDIKYHLNETDRSCLIKTALMSRSFA